MRKGQRKMWWVVPCASRKSMGTESRKDIEEILKAKLATIVEEPEVSEEMRTLAKHQSTANMRKKVHGKVKMGKSFMPHYSLKESYVLFISGLASKGSLGGIPRW